MAEQVSVRLAVVGGTQFRNELTAAGANGSQAMDRIAASSRKLGPQIQNASYQIGDFAVQVASGQSATRAFAQQMPQLLGGFGMLGAVAGAGVAVMAALAPLFFKSADGAAKLEGSIGGVEGATSSLEAVQREYNDAIARQSVVSTASAAAVIANTAAEFSARKELLAIEIDLLRVRGDAERRDLAKREKDYRKEADAAVRNGIDPETYFGPDVGKYVNIGPRNLDDVNRSMDGFLERSKDDALKIRKLRAEQAMTELMLKRSSDMLNKEFKDITANPDAGKNPDKTDKKGGGGGKSKENELLKEQQKLFDETRTKAEKYAIEMERIEALYNSGAISADVYQRKMAMLKEQYATQGKFAADAANTVKSAMDGLFDSMFEGGNKAGEAIESLGKKLASMAAQQAVYQVLAKLMPGTFGADGFIPLLKNANGNAFSGGRVIPFAAGGVVTSATMFPMRGGTGLMGEAGPEAIMPLTRVGGKLGVRSAGGGGGRGTVVQVIDQRQSGAPIREERSRGPDGREMVKLIVGEETARGSFDNANASRFGSAPKKVRR